MISVLTGTQIARFQWVALRGALRLEKLGMKRSVRPSARQIVLKASGLKSSATYDELIEFANQRIKEFE